VNSIGAAPVPPSPPSTTMKSGVMPVSSIVVAEREFKANRLTAGPFAQQRNKIDQFQRRGKRGMLRRRQAVFADRNAAGRSDLRRHFSAR
jgi:hypothetical protein